MTNRVLTIAGSIALLAGGVAVDRRHLYDMTGGADTAHFFKNVFQNFSKMNPDMNKDDFNFFGYDILKKCNPPSPENKKRTIKPKIKSKDTLININSKLEDIFNEIPKKKKFTFTYDNGTEIGKEDEWLEKKLGIEIYRAYPYHSWERGCNENFNGLVREFFPKGMKFANIKESEIKKMQNLLNNRPRKRCVAE